MFNFFFYLYLFLPIIVIGLIVFLIFFQRHKKYVEFQQCLYFILYEITLPHEKPQEGEKNFKDLISVMEQFYKRMLAIDSYFVLEIGLPVVGREIVFYAAVERKQSHLFEKLAQGLFPQVQISIKTNNYNIFKPDGFSFGSLAKLKREEILPIRTYDKFESDPLQLIINTFSKLKDEGEGAGLQIIISPTEELFKLLESKTSRQMTKVNIRLLASAKNKERGESILAELESAFSQFSEAQGNKFEFVRVRGRKLKDLFYKFSFRIPEKKTMFTLNTAELASIFYFSPYRV